MSQEQKMVYFPPEAKLICFQPVERIATEDDIGYDATMATFSNERGIAGQSLSFEVTDPDFDGWD